MNEIEPVAHRKQMKKNIETEDKEKKESKTRTSSKAKPFKVELSQGQCRTIPINLCIGIYVWDIVHVM